MIIVSIVLINTPKLLFEDKIRAYEKEQLLLTVALQQARIDYASLTLEHLQLNAPTTSQQEFIQQYHGNLCVIGATVAAKCPPSIINAVQNAASNRALPAQSKVKVAFAEGSTLFFKPYHQQIQVLWFNHASFWPAPQNNISLVLVRGNRVQFIDNPIDHYKPLLNYTILSHRNNYGTIQFENTEMSFLRWNIDSHQLISVFSDNVSLFHLIYWVMSFCLTILLVLAWVLTRINLQKLTAQRRVYLDNLTRLHNRHFLSKISHKFIDDPRSVAAMIDIDHFKKINDKYGHITGDRILQSVAVCLRKNVRDTDVIIRFGGEEFLVLFQASSVNEAWHTLDRLRQRVKDDHQLYDTSISIGFSAINGNLSAAIARADSALYQAKQAGRNQVIHAQDHVTDAANDYSVSC
ncbi:MAG: GGDEF domain-containing protein [Vibrio sp.]